ncbi:MULTISPECIES: DUF5134 domain-containing protein [unclassified Streptomyces]|uniref:DUF5134 domain-containing protein n=1 Tax=unclassified Streptomyces TaxID=2593676 RepID=UPI00035F40F5|nr:MULTISPECIES: DUF5134 domain-containing protein [unclassified Streptomyces]MYQ79891.1 DUF5134 domain-containing protein [Streptomyces sp. SID4923]
MIAANGLRWILSLLFCALAVYGLWRAFMARTHSWTARLAHGLHAVMALAMFAMAWSWGMDLPATPQVIFFSAAAAWFVVAALALPAGPEPRGRALAGALPHALMTGAMAWMAAVMASGMSMGAAGGGQAHDMPGMDMSAPGALATMTLSGSGDRWGAGLLALLMLALALGWLAKGFDTGRPVPRAAGDAGSSGAVQAAWDLGCHGLMALGMAVMFAVMV